MTDSTSARGNAVLLPEAGIPPVVMRRVGWAFLPVLMALFWLGTSDGLPEALRIVVGRASYALPVLLSVLLGYLAAAQSDGVERRFWLLLSTANAALLTSEIIYGYWLLAIDPTGPPRVMWPFQTLHLIAAIAFLGVLASMTRFALASTTARLRYVADIAVLGLVLYVFSLELYVRPVMESAGAPTADVLVGAAYPVVAFLMVFGAAVNVVGLKMVTWRSWEKLVMVALAIYVAGVAAWPAWYASAGDVPRNYTRGVLDLVQLTGHYVLLMATVYRLTEAREWFHRPLAPFTLTRRRWLSAVTPLLGLVAVLLVLAAAFRRADDGTWALVYGVIAAALMGLTLTRSSLTALEHGLLFHRSITDPLTGLYNHRYFHDRLAEEVRAGSRLEEDLALIVIDIDDFSQVNSVYGHFEGDRLLADIAAKIRDRVPEDAFVARIGGDEFAVIVPDMSLGEATVVAQRVIDAIDIEVGPAPGMVSASAGVATAPEQTTEPEELFRLADCAMLWGKEHGKKCVVPFQSGRVPELTTRERLEFVERQTRLSSVRALAAAVDARDPATRFHSQHVASLSMNLAVRLGLPEQHIQRIGQAAVLHDIGKISVPDSVLSKPAALDPEERRKVEEHPQLGERILAATDLGDILSWVRSHHERWDGAGYPDGLSGEAIPLESRIMAVCDAYDAMVSDRPYRSALTRQAARQEIDHNIGSQFDPHVAEEFIRMISDDEQMSIDSFEDLFDSGIAPTRTSRSGP